MSPIAMDDAVDAAAAAVAEADMAIVDPPISIAWDLL